MKTRKPVERLDARRRHATRRRNSDRDGGGLVYTAAMINGAHFLFYSTDPEADRAFFRDVLEFRSVDVGHGWLIFKLPPAEVAVHPSNGELRQPPADHMLGAVLYLMCDDIRSAVKSLEAKKVTCSPLTEEPWGTVTTFTVPSGGGVGLYQPSHPTALDLGMS